MLVVADSLGAEPRVVIDPNPLSYDATLSLAGKVEQAEDRVLDVERLKVRCIAAGMADRRAPQHATPRRSIRDRRAAAVGPAPAPGVEAHVDQR